MFYLLLAAAPRRLEPMFLSLITQCRGPLSADAAHRKPAISPEAAHLFVNSDGIGRGGGEVRELA